MSVFSALIALVASVVTVNAGTRPLWYGIYSEHQYVMDQIFDDGMGGVVAMTGLVDAPFDQTTNLYSFGFYIFNPTSQEMIGYTVEAGSGITYNATTQKLTFGINSATQTALDGKGTTAQGAKADSAVQPAAMTSALGSYATTAAMTSGLGLKFNTPTGSTSQYLRGDGSVATFPSIPAAQVQSDWNAVSGLGVVLNKPTIPTIPGNATTSVAGLMSATDKTKLDAQSGTNTGDQTSVTGNAGTVTTINGRVSVGTGITLTGSGTSGSPYNLALTKAPVLYAGTTDASGNYTVSYGFTYGVKPQVLFSVEGGTIKDSSVLTSTTTGFTINVQRRTEVLGLLPTYANVAGLAVNVSVTPN